MAAGTRRVADETSSGMVEMDSCRVLLSRRTLLRLVSTCAARRLGGGDPPLQESLLSSLTARSLLVCSLAVAAEAVPGHTLQDAEHSLRN